MNDNNEVFPFTPEKKEGNCFTWYAPDNTFFIIDGMIAADPRISLEAKGLYFVLLTVEHSPQRPKLRGFDIIWNEKNLALVQELIEAGYCQREGEDHE